MGWRIGRGLELRERRGGFGPSRTESKLARKHCDLMADQIGFELAVRSRNDWL
jgi:hypothetical protein